MLLIGITQFCESVKSRVKSPPWGHLGEQNLSPFNVWRRLLPSRRIANIHANTANERRDLLQKTTTEISQKYRFASKI